MPKFKIGDYVQDTDDQGHGPIFGTICAPGSLTLNGELTYMVDAATTSPYWVSIAKKPPAGMMLAVAERALIRARPFQLQQAADAADYYDAITS